MSKKISNPIISLNNRETEKGSTRLEINISGSKIDCVVVNTLRRMVLSEVPVYAFTNFTFNKNTSVFHNNFIKNQIMNMPVWGIKNKIEYYEEKNVESYVVDNNNDEIEDNVDLSVDKNVDTTSLEQLTMYVDYENKTNDIISVTTNDVKFYFAQKNIDNPYNHPIQIVKLQPKQSINFSVVTSVGIEKISSIFSPVSICCYSEKAPDDYNFILESRGQLEEKQILHIAIINLKKKLENIIKQISNNNEPLGELIIINEDHTVGNLLTHYLQSDKQVLFAGYNMPHPLEKRVIINYKLKSGNIKEILSNKIDEIIELYTYLDEQFKKLY